jgi:phosphoribosylformylglycinamidine synthase I
MKTAVIVFPGSNCDHDAYYSTSEKAGFETEYVWHKESKLPSGLDLVILPGGFSYGDYLRCGAIARFSPVMEDVVKFANAGGYVMGICNGFQMLTELKLLPGTLLRNASLNFICKDVLLKPENNSAFTASLNKRVPLRIPVAHGDGNYFADEETMKKIEDTGMVAFRYCDPDGNITKEANPNGSLNNIAGITNEKKNVLGMMPHPERYSDAALGCADGLGIFKSLSENFSKSELMEV